MWVLKAFLLIIVLGLVDGYRSHSKIQASYISRSSSDRILQAETMPVEHVGQTHVETIGMPQEVLAALLLQFRSSPTLRFGRATRMPPPSMKGSTRKVGRAHPNVPQASAQTSFYEAATPGIADAEVVPGSVFPDFFGVRLDESLRQIVSTLMVAITLAPHTAMASDAVSAYNSYSTPDRTGLIGGIASLFEALIELAHTGLGDYGLCIFLLTLLIKAVTLPLVNLQIKTTSQLSQVAPVTKRIYDAFPNKDEVKDKLNRLTTKAYNDVGVNPLAALWPIFAQIPVYFALSRTLRNLAAEGKLTEPFLWLPNLAGPRYQQPRDHALDWITSIFSGSPQLGWGDTAAFLSLPIILVASQKVSQSLLQVPRDLDAETKEMPLSLKGSLGRKIIPFIKDNWPIFILFYFALNSAAGLPLYWIYNNVLTTIVTLVEKSRISSEVEKSLDPVLASLEEELKSNFNMTFDDLPSIEEEQGVTSSTLNDMWIYLPTSRKNLDIRSEPTMDSQLTKFSLEPEALFRVSDIHVAEDKVTFLKLADGRGWIIDKIPGIGQQCFTREKFDQMADSMLKRGVLQISGALSILLGGLLIGDFLQ